MSRAFCLWLAGALLASASGCCASRELYCSLPRLCSPTMFAGLDHCGAEKHQPTWPHGCCGVRPGGDMWPGEWQNLPCCDNCDCCAYWRGQPQYAGWYPSTYAMQGETITTPGPTPAPRREAEDGSVLHPREMESSRRPMPRQHHATRPQRQSAPQGSSPRPTMAKSSHPNAPKLSEFNLPPGAQVLDQSDRLVSEGEDVPGETSEGFSPPPQMASQPARPSTMPTRQASGTPRRARFEAPVRPTSLRR